MPTIKATYKCRLCGQECTDGETGEDIAEFAVCQIGLKGNVNLNSNKKTFGVYENNCHCCENGSYGMADFIGFRKED